MRLLEDDHAFRPPVSDEGRGTLASLHRRLDYEPMPFGPLAIVSKSQVVEGAVQRAVAPPTLATSTV